QAVDALQMLAFDENLRKEIPVRELGTKLNLLKGQDRFIGVELLATLADEEKKFDEARPFLEKSFQDKEMEIGIRAASALRTRDGEMDMKFILPLLRKEKDKIL